MITFAVGILWAPFPHWKTLRSFALMRIREEGFGKSAIEPEIMSEIDVFIGQFITPTIGKLLSIHHAILKFTYNLISEMISNTRMDYEDPQLQFLLGKWMVSSLKQGYFYDEKLAHTEQLVTQRHTRKEVP